MDPFLTVDDAKEALRLNREAAFRSATGSRTRASTSRGGTYETRIAEFQERLRQIEVDAREREARLEERARREGALPGWIR